MDPRSLAFASGALGSSASPVHVRWLGTAGFEIRHDEHVLLIDPYITRASLAACVLTRLRPDEALLRRTVPRADAIVLGHTHFDHALDAPSIARATGARVFGSRSAAALCRSRGVDEARIVVVEPLGGGAPVEHEVGPFRLRFHPNAHAPLLLGRVPFPGEIADCGDVPMRAREYRCGAVFGVEIRVAGKTLFHLGSAELLDGALGRLEVDLVMLCVAGWRSTERFPERAMRALSPRAAVLAHWDNFLLPFDRGASPLPAMHLDRLVDRLTREARDVRVGTVAIGEDLTI